MEQRLIDANALFKAFEKAAWYNNADRDEIAEEILEQMPTIETEFVRHGRWVYTSSACSWLTAVERCSHCGAEDEGLNNWNYCPNCGAKMDLEGD